MTDAAHATRLARVLGVPLAPDAVRQWPQSGEVVVGRERIAEVESHFEGLRLRVGRRLATDGGSSSSGARTTATVACSATSRSPRYATVRRCV